MQRNEYGLRKINWGIALLALLLSLAAGYYLSAGMEKGFLVYDWLDKMQNTVFKEPFRNYWNAYSLPCMLAAFFCYLSAGLYYLATAKNYMRGKEFGTARFAEAKKLNRELADLSNDVNDERNVVLSCRKRWMKKVYRIERK